MATEHPAIEFVTTAKLGYFSISTLLALNLKKWLFFQVIKTLPISHVF